MNKIVILLIALMVIVVGFLSGCIGGRSLKGSWRDTDGDIWKFMDSTVYINFESNSETFPYSIDGDKLYIPGWLTEIGSNQTGDEIYYTMNWIDDRTLELTTSVYPPYIEILYRQ